MSENCAVCGIPARQFCSACKSVKYCGAEHQKKHWKVHKAECRPFRIANDPDLGRFLLATRDIKADSVIFTESPLEVGPKWYLSEQDEHCPIWPCVGCFTPCRIGGSSCPRCTWPACSSSCPGLTNTKLHAVECPILCLGRGPTDLTNLKSLKDYYRADALVVLKFVMLQKKCPKKWAELMDMQSHEEDRLGSDLYVEAENRIVSYLQDTYLKRLRDMEASRQCKLLEHSDEAILHKICGIIETNYMCISLQNGLELSGVYYTACMMEHSCQPNCYFLFDHSNGFKISVIAGRTIAKGEHLQIMYSNMLWGTQMRHEHLQMTKHFVCKCARCMDPTELGTYFSGMKCVGDVGTDCGGLQLPMDPLSLSTDWKCNICPMTVNGEEIRYLLTQMSEEVDAMLATKPTVKMLEQLIHKLSQFLHPSHYHLFGLKHSLIQLYGTEHGATIDILPNEILIQKMKLCKELLDVCNKLDPHAIRLSIYVGIILFEMNNVLVEQGKRMLQEERDQEKAVLGFKLARNHMHRAAEILKKEVDNVAGSKLREAVAKGLSHLEGLIAFN